LKFLCIRPIIKVLARKGQPGPSLVSTGPSWPEPKKIGPCPPLRSGYFCLIAKYPKTDS